MAYIYKTIKSPVGELKIVADNQSVVGILWENDTLDRVFLESISENKTHPILSAAEKQLQSYFKGNLKQFTLPLNFLGTEFQQKVWNALLTIPYGETRSYKQIAEQIGHPKAVRAVGTANGKNPISIIAPCHRVIGSNGKLTGFAGGLETKAFLLDLEEKTP
jgi:methylated-DNA-[protein]-cysteine S-methyltransferase